MLYDFCLETLCSPKSLAGAVATGIAVGVGVAAAVSASAAAVVSGSAAVAAQAALCAAAAGLSGAAVETVGLALIGQEGRRNWNQFLGNRWITLLSATLSSTTAFGGVAGVLWYKYGAVAGISSSIIGNVGIAKGVSGLDKMTRPLTITSAVNRTTALIK
jgi:hypothetical protein